jgi:hypothetical protein
MTGFYREPDESSPYCPALCVSHCSIFYHLSLYLPCGLFPSGFPSKIAYNFIFPPIHAFSFFSYKGQPVISNYVVSLVFHYETVCWLPLGKTSGNIELSGETLQSERASLVEGSSRTKITCPALHRPGSIPTARHVQIYINSFAKKLHSMYGAYRFDVARFIHVQYINIIDETYNGK